VQPRSCHHHIVCLSTTTIRPQTLQIHPFRLTPNELSSLLLNQAANRKVPSLQVQLSREASALARGATVCLTTKSIANSRLMLPTTT
jgi:hypothetical protein